ncbi:hypothetical protein EMIHUDRAFT_195043 [Emiliania huxleyi CCMP1516]|uniref:HMA domain-containing protein n=2 Tax=Emiliania huxleyi TaxID=2903 RepID=A0A0D3JGT5_EMIH1|nr:hypothetical protein EMIHUDRAFT_195043 [Emiliania huxleyi CCMP1516]EOD22720.1 hypothetical protein EMIHUDRAFT_195043 [Emiliania huxleyi CCMP1516]|eukprot:XP_005775149.1 hypothetical protein EMIHUDRAFT_195043 [Emiliania huxleyi CCMP1516]
MARVVDEHTSTVAISGITCGGCKEIVRQAILGVEGVVSCSVDVLAGEATIRGSVSREALSAALEATGRVILPPGCSLTTLRVGGMTCGVVHHSLETNELSVRGAAPSVGGGDGLSQPLLPAASPLAEDSSAVYSREVTLALGGMTCASCVSAVEGGLKALPGVEGASVSLMAMSGHVKYDERLVDVPTIVAKVSALGYSAEPQAGDEAAGAAARSFGREAAYWRRRFWLSLLFTLPVFLLSMVLPGLTVLVLVNLLLTTPVQCFFGLPFHRGCLASLRHRTFNMDVLVSLGTFAAYGARYDRPPLRTRRVHLHRTPAARRVGYSIVFLIAAMLITFLLLGKFLESAAKGRASSAISQLLNLQPPTALQLTTCKDIEQAARRGGRLWLRRGHGDVVKVLPGAQVPVDGRVL